MCLAQGPQRSDAGEARTHGPSVLSQTLYHTSPLCTRARHSILCLVLVQPRKHPDMMIEKLLTGIRCFKKFFRVTIRVSHSLDPDQAKQLHFVGSDLGPNCLQGLSASSIEF